MPNRRAAQDGVVDTSGGDYAPTHGESLKQKLPVIADFITPGGPGTSEAGAGNDNVYEADDPKNQPKKKEKED